MQVVLLGEKSSEEPWVLLKGIVCASSAHPKSKHKPSGAASCFINGVDFGC